MGLFCGLPESIRGHMAGSAITRPYDGLVDYTLSLEFLEDVIILGHFLLHVFLKDILWPALEARRVWGADADV